jgi:hypothetical protein
MTLTLSLFSFALVWASGWCAHAAVRRQRQQSEFVHVEKLSVFKRYEQEMAEDARRRLAMCAERRQA